MPQIIIRMDGDGAFRDVPPAKLAITEEPMLFTCLVGGMSSGKPSVAIGLFLPNDGGCVVGQTSLELLLTAADALKARYGDPRIAPEQVPKTPP